MEYLIDPRGTWSRWPDENLAYRLGYPQPDFDLAGYAARNLGYVWLLIERGMTLLQFRAGMVSAQTVGALKPYLSKATADAPVALVYYASGWMEEVFIEPAALIARFQLVAGMREPRQREKFLSAAVSIDAWSTKSRCDLAGLFSLWREKSGVLDDGVHRFLQATSLANRMLMMQHSGEQGLHITYSGDGYTAYDQFSYRRFVGQKLTEQPDKAYGTWAERGYDACLRDGVPRVEDVDAIVDQTGHDARRRRYRRLLLRWQTPNGKPVVLGGSLLNQNIAIPIDVAGLAG